MIKMPVENDLKENPNKDSPSRMNESRCDDTNKEGDKPHSSVEQSKPCGRSYSSAKALKDHIKTVHTDKNIYSCHVSRFLFKIYSFIGRKLILIANFKKCTLKSILIYSCVTVLYFAFVTFTASILFPNLLCFYVVNY